MCVCVLLIACVGLSEKSTTYAKYLLRIWLHFFFLLNVDKL